MVMLVSCADPFGRGRPEPHFEREVEAARAAGAVIGLIDHDALVRGDVAEAVRRMPHPQPAETAAVGDDGATQGAGIETAWYRGWMMPSERYGRLATALAERGIHLATDAAQYRRAHELPGWYPTLREHTPASAWLENAPGRFPATPELELLAKRLAEQRDDGAAAASQDSLKPGGGAAIVKDYVKSAKHRWFEACYVPSVTDLAVLEQVVHEFVREQEEFLAGGVVLREFEDFEGAQVRVWWLDGRPTLVTAHPDTPDDLPQPAEAPEPAQFATAVARLECRFLTTDLARRRDGAWRIIEAGDGQVSDLPRSADPTELISALLRAQAAPATPSS